MAVNPWAIELLRREAAYGPVGTGAYMEAKYAHEQESWSCEEQDCGGDVFYKPTIGCWKCTECGELFHSDRERLGN